MHSLIDQLVKKNKKRLSLFWNIEKGGKTSIKRENDEG
jgi:hypothetical protein